MNLRVENLKEDEWVLLHDFYSESPEPDAPKSKFKDLSKEAQELAAKHYSSSNFKGIMIDDEFVGFVGFFPDDDDNVNLFCVISPKYRSKGYFSKILALSLDYCRKEFAGYKYIRALTRKQNIPSVKGLERFSFVRKGELIEEVQPDVIYEEYLLPI